MVRGPPDPLLPGHAAQILAAARQIQSLPDRSDLHQARQRRIRAVQVTAGFSTAWPQVEHGRRFDGFLSHREKQLAFIAGDSHAALDPVAIPVEEFGSVEEVLARPEEAVHQDVAGLAQGFREVAERAVAILLAIHMDEVVAAAGEFGELLRIGQQIGGAGIAGDLAGPFDGPFVAAEILRVVIDAEVFGLGAGVQEGRRRITEAHPHLQDSARLQHAGEGPFQAVIRDPVGEQIGQRILREGGEPEVVSGLGGGLQNFICQHGTITHSAAALCGSPPHSRAGRRRGG